MPKSVGFTPPTLPQESMILPTMSSMVPRKEPTTEVQLKRARLQIAQLKAENIRLRRKMKINKSDTEEGTGNSPQKSIESSLCNMEPSPATSISPMPVKRRTRKTKKPLAASKQEVSQLSQSQLPSESPSPRHMKAFKAKKSSDNTKGHITKLTETSGGVSNASGEKKASKNAFKRKVNMVKKQINMEVEATFKKGIQREKALQKALKA